MNLHWWSNLLIVLIIVAALFGAAGVNAQGPIQVWHTLSPDASAALQAAGADLGVAVEYIEAPRLADEVMNAAQPPDVIIAGEDAIAPLRQYGLVTPVGGERGFFLTPWLENLPALLAQQCAAASMQDCLWGGDASARWIPVPDARSLAATASWLCDVSPWLAFCPGGTKGGSALGWNFRVFFVSDNWLTDYGLRAPRSSTELFELRGKYRLNFVDLAPEQYGQAAAPDAGTVYIVGSGGLIAAPDEFMAALSNFAAAGFVPVVSLDVYGVYITVQAGAPALDFAQRLAEDRASKLGLMQGGRILPALDAGALAQADPQAALTMLRALTVLNGYASLSY